MMTTIGGDERRSGRANVLLTATLDSGGNRLRVRVANLSAHGALVISDAAATEGAEVTFRCNTVAVAGWVAWVRKPYAGIHFGEAIELEALLRNLPSAQQVITADTRVLNFRRPGFRGNQLTEAERKAVEEWARPSRVRLGE